MIIETLISLSDSDHSDGCHESQSLPRSKRKMKTFSPYDSEVTAPAPYIRVRRSSTTSTSTVAGDWPASDHEEPDFFGGLEQLCNAAATAEKQPASLRVPLKKVKLSSPTATNTPLGNFSSAAIKADMLCPNNYPLLQIPTALSPLVAIPEQSSTDSEEAQKGMILLLPDWQVKSKMYVGTPFVYSKDPVSAVSTTESDSSELFSMTLLPVADYLYGRGAAEPLSCGPLPSGSRTRSQSMCSTSSLMTAASAFPGSPSRQTSHSSATTATSSTTVVNPIAEVSHPAVTVTAAPKKRRGRTASVKKQAGRMFLCPFENCGMEFNTKFSMKRHQKKHTNQRPFSCEWPSCRKSFAEKSTLERHLRTHTGDRPYKCPATGCRRSFADRTNVRRHVLTHENGEALLADVNIMSKLVRKATGM